MEWSEASMDNCPVGRSLDLVGEKWTLHIVRDALNGIRRFDDFRVHLGISEPLLTDRLALLVDAGVLERRPYQDPGQRVRHEYWPTPKGFDLFPVLVALKAWGEEHLGDPNRHAVDTVHRGCGGNVGLELRCERHPEEAVGLTDVAVVVGPGGRPTDRPLPRRD